MKPTKITKYVDHLGRFKIPKELLISHDIKPNSLLKISRGRMSIILEKENHNCIFCLSSKNIHVFKDKFICEDCIKNLKKII